MSALILTWRRDAGGVHYRLNGVDVGAGDAGFDAVLAAIRDDPAATVTLTPDRLMLGGEDLAAATPFAARFAELTDALDGRLLTWSLDLAR